MLRLPQCLRGGTTASQVLLEPHRVKSPMLERRKPVAPKGLLRFQFSENAVMGHEKMRDRSIIARLNARIGFFGDFAKLEFVVALLS